MRTDRRIAVPGGDVRAWQVGDDDAERTALLFLHGGPGGSAEGFMSLGDLADRRRLVMFDQLGSRTSTWDGDPDQLWTVDRFCAEVDAIRTAWKLDEVVLVGHSWGGWLAIDSLCRHTSGVRGAVLCDTTASFASFRAAIARRVGQLSEPSRRAVAEAEATGDLDTSAYRAAALEFYDSFVVRHVPGDDVAGEVFDRQRSCEVFQYMQGPDELHGDGSLADWDRRADLAEVRVPALVIAGRHDHMDPEAAAELTACLPDADLIVFEDSSHCPHLEQPGDVVRAIADWLDDRRL